MHFGVNSLREIEDFDELVEEAGRTIHMLVNECSNRDKYDVYDYLSQAEAVLDLIRERTDQLKDTDELLDEIFDDE
jgi:hypothetical protein